MCHEIKFQTQACLDYQIFCIDIDLQKEPLE